MEVNYIVQRRQEGMHVSADEQKDNRKTESNMQNIQLRK